MYRHLSNVGQGRVVRDKVAEKIAEQFYANPNGVKVLVRADLRRF